MRIYVYVYINKLIGTFIFARSFARQLNSSGAIPSGLSANASRQPIILAVRGKENAAAVARILNRLASDTTSDTGGRSGFAICTNEPAQFNSRSLCVRSPGGFSGCSTGARAEWRTVRDHRRRHQFHVC